MEKFLDIVANWAERSDLGFSATRSEQGDWFARIELRDGRGWFNVFTPIMAQERGETLDAFQKRIEKSLSRMIAQEREKRIRSFTGRSPSVRVAA